MDKTLFGFVEDYLDEGDVMFDRVAASGVDGFAAAFTYHTARDVLPHAGARRVRFMESGALRFHPDEPRYSTPPGVPYVASVTTDKDPLDAMVDGFAEHSISLHAWLVLCHSTGIGTKLPEWTVQTAHGDQLLSALCPSNPAVVAYFANLITDLANRGIGRLYLEGLDFSPIEHGFHHERWMQPIGELAKFVLGCCFCPSCMHGAERTGIDAEGARADARIHVDDALSGAQEVKDPLTYSRLSETLSSRLTEYVDSRTDRVTEALTELSATARASSTDLFYLDLTGARVRSQERPVDQTLSAETWRYGIDPNQIAPLVAGYLPLGYWMDAQRLALEVAAYGGKIGDDATLGCLIRPGYPDTRDEADLAEKLDAVASLPSGHLGLYAYGFLRLDELETVSRLLALSAT